MPNGQPALHFPARPCPVEYQRSNESALELFLLLGPWHLNLMGVGYSAI